MTALIAKRLLLTMPFVALLAACGGADAGSTETTEPGEVLEGTISDGMLPLDRVRSHAPLEAPVASAAADGAAAEADDGEGEGAETDAEGGEDASAAEPDAAASPTADVGD